MWNNIMQRLRKGLLYDLTTKSNNCDSTILNYIFFGFMGLTKQGKSPLGTIEEPPGEHVPTVWDC